MRLVLDTNTVLSALLWRGTPYRLLETIRNQHPHLQHRLRRCVCFRQ